MRLLGRVFLIACLTLTIGYLVVVGLAYARQDSMLFHRGVARQPKTPVVEAPQATYCLMPPPAPKAKVLVHFHGNAEQLADLDWLAQKAKDRGWGFVAVEYPGYGLAPGITTEASMVAAAEGALFHLTTKQSLEREQLVLSGRSLGTGVAMAMAERGWGERVVLMSPYTSLPDVAALQLPYLPVRLLMKVRFNSLSRAGQVKQPVLIVHGTKDELIPVEMGAQLAGALAKGRLVRVENAGHNDLDDRDETWDAIAAFLKE